MASTVLLVSREPPSTALMDQLESSGLCVEATSSRRFERTLEVVGPDLVVHLGWAGSHDVVAVLARRATRRPLVLVVDRDRLLQARDMDRDVVASVLLSDLPVGRLAERIARLTSSAGQGSSNQVQRAPRRIALVDDDVTRADALAQALRERGLDVQLTPGDPKITRWALLRRFAPDVFVASGEGKLSEAWLGLQRADGQLSEVPLRTVPYGRVFDETSGAVRLDVLLRRIGMDDAPSGALEGTTSPLSVPASTSEEDGDFDDERPTLLIQEVAPDSLDDAGERLTLAMQDDEGERLTLALDADDDEDRPTLIADDEDRPTVAIDGELGPGAAAQPAVAAPSAPRQRRAGPLLAVVLGIALLGAGGWWWSRRSDGALRSNVSPARPTVEDTTRALPRGDGETSAIEPPDLPATLGHPGTGHPLTVEPGTGPWVVPESSAVSSCEALLDPTETLPRGDVAQASRYWEKARAALVLGDVRKAQGWMCRAVHVYPQSLAAEGLAESYLNLGAPREAKRWIDVAMAHRPGRPRTLELLGDIENQLGDVERSRRLWLRAFQLPDEEEATLTLLARDQMNKADAAFRDGDSARAEIHYRRAAVLRPQSDAGPLGLARLARMSDEGERAALWAKEALRRNPSSAEALRLEREAAVRVTVPSNRPE